MLTVDLADVFQLDASLCTRAADEYQDYCCGNGEKFHRTTHNQKIRSNDSVDSQFTNGETIFEVLDDSTSGTFKASPEKELEGRQPVVELHSPISLAGGEDTTTLVLGELRVSDALAEHGIVFQDIFRAADPGQ